MPIPGKVPFIVVVTALTTRDVLVIANDLRGDRDLLVLFVGQSEPSTDFGVDAFDQFPIPVFRESNPDSQLSLTKKQLFKRIEPL